MAKGNRRDEIQGEIVHVYDGIEESDNELPRWWLATLYITIFFGAGYWFYYHEYNIGKLPPEAYAEELAAQAARGGTVTNELLDGLAGSSSEVSAGQGIFAQNCAVCHGQRAEGNIGPNLTDNAWIHGGSPLQIHDTIKNGVGSKGMPAWGNSLGPQSVRRLTAYILSVRNTNVAGKPAQGDPYNP